MKILLIDDNAEDIAYIRDIIVKSSNKGHLLVNTKTINQGIQILNSGRIGIILLTLFLSDTEDFSGLKEILKLFPGTPVIVFTPLGNEEYGTNAMYLGAQDYLVKGEMKSTGLIQSIRNSLIRHSSQMQTQNISNYLADNLDYLKKVIHYGLQAQVFPDYTIIFKELKATIDDLAIPDIFSLFLFDKKKNQFNLVTHNCTDWKNLDKPLIVSDRESIMFEAFRRKKTIRQDEFLQNRITGENHENVFKDNQGLCIPLIQNLEVLGILNLNNHAAPGYSPEFLMKIKMVVHDLATAVKNNLINKGLEELLLSDDLTGLYNRRYLSWELDREIKRVKRYRGSLSLLVMDIINFKKINDEYGYKTGDFILKKIAIQLKKLIRITDLIGRYDGDEFVAVLIETNSKGARILKNRIQKNITEFKIDIEKKPTIQVNLHIENAEYDYKLKDAKEFISYVKNLDERQENKKVETGPVPGVKEEKPVPALDIVRVYFIEPLQLISVVIDALVKMGFESYQVDEKDKLKLLKILHKNTRNVIFICISSQNEINTWLGYISKIEQMRKYVIQVGAFVYSRMDPQYGIRFLEKNIALIKFSDLQQDTLAVLKKILIYFEAKGRRGYVRVDTVDDSMAFFTIEGERKVIKARILTISEQIFTCYFTKQDIHYIMAGRYFYKVLLRLKGIVVQISAKAIAPNKLDRFLWIMQICSSLIKNKKISYTKELSKEIKDKLHRYIRFCLKESIKQKLLDVQL